MAAGRSGGGVVCIRLGDGGGRDKAGGPASLDSGSELSEGSGGGKCCETSIL